MQPCSFCSELSWVFAEKARVSICRRCTAKLGRLIGIIGRGSRRFWRFRRVGASSAPESEEREIVGLPKELRLDEPHPEDFAHAWGAPQYRVAGLGYYAAFLLRSPRPSALGLRVAGAFLGSVEAEYAAIDGLVQGATNSCIAALFDSRLFRSDQFQALRDELQSSL